MFPALERILRTWDVFSATAGRHTLAVIALLLVLSHPRAARARPSRHALGAGLLLLGFFGMSVTSLLTTLSVRFLERRLGCHRLGDQPDHLGHHRAACSTACRLLPGIVIGSMLSTAGGLVSIFGGDAAAMELRGGEVLARRRQCALDMVLDDGAALARRLFPAAHLRPDGA